MTHLTNDTRCHAAKYLQPLLIMSLLKHKRLNLPGPWTDAAFYFYLHNIGWVDANARNSESCVFCNIL